MTNQKLPEVTNNEAYIHVADNKVVSMSEGFSALTGYGFQEIADKAAGDVLTSLLKIRTGSVDYADAQGMAECYLFTKSLEAVEVELSVKPAPGERAKYYTFTEKPNSRLGDVLNYPCQLIEDNILGVAIYSAPENILLKANQAYLEFFDPPYNCPEGTFGKSVYDYIKAYPGSKAEARINNILVTGKSEYIKELQYNDATRGMVYFDQIITPIKVAGKIKYLVTNALDVTEQVLSRKQNEAQKHELRLQKEKLESILENISDQIFIFDKFGNYETVNKSPEQSLVPMLNMTGNINVMPEHTKFNDLNDRALSFEQSPFVKILNGEKISDYRLKIIIGGQEIYLTHNGAPVYDESGHFVYGVLSSRIINDQILYERKIAEQNKLLSAVLENMHVAVSIFDRNGRYSLVNQQARETYPQYLKYPTVNDIPTSFQFFDLEDVPVPRDKLPRLRVMNGETIRNERYVVKLPEKILIMEVNATPIYDDSQQLIAAVLSHNNITDLIQNQKALGKSKALLQEKNEILRRQGKLLELSNEAIFAFDKNGDIVDWNNGCAQLYGFTSAEAKGKRAIDLLQSVSPCSLEVIQESISRFGVWAGELVHKTKNGDLVIVESKLQLIPHENGHVVLETNRDITGRKQAEKLLAEAKEIADTQNKLLNTILENTSAGIVVLAADGEILHINSFALRKLQLNSENEYQNYKLYDNYEITHLDGTPIPPDEIARERALRGGAFSNYIMCSKHKDMENAFVGSYNAKPIYDDNGKMIFTVITMTDITKQILDEQTLRESEMKLKLAAKSAAIGTYMYSFITGEMHWSSELKALGGLGPDELATEKDALHYGVHPDDQQKFLSAVAAAGDPSGDGAIELDYRFIRPDGTVRWLLARGQTTFSEAGNGEAKRPRYSAGAVIDITDRINAENRIKKISAQLQNIIESTDDMIYSVDQEYKIVFFNTAVRNYAKKTLGKEIFYGIKLTDVFPPKVAETFIELVQRAMNDGKFQVDLKSYQDNRVIAYSLNPVYITKEQVLVTIFGKDITDRLSSEREIMRLNNLLEERVAERTAQLEQSVENLKNITLILSHDLKTPLREINAIVESATEHQNIEACAAKIRKTSSALISMIDDLMDYELSARSDIHQEKVNIKKMILSVFNQLKGDLSVQSAELDFETGLPVVKADKELLRHVILNILSNALKFSSNDSSAKIVVGCRAENEAYVFYVKDNGIGMDMRYADKVFGVFERLHSKDEFEGSGVGLAIVRSIIQQHGGKTWIESDKGSGTTVYFSLPA